MTNAPKRWLYWTVGFACGLLAMGARPLKAQGKVPGDCKTILAAANKTLTTATHTYAKTNIAGTDQDVETIFLPGVVYTRMNGKWTNAQMTPEQLADLHKTTPQSDALTCKYLRDEPVNGEMAAVYSAHEVTSKGTVDTQMWISKAKGLLLRQEMDLGPKFHMSMRFEYGNVKAPI